MESTAPSCRGWFFWGGKLCVEGKRTVHIPRQFNCERGTVNYARM